ncbi:MAG: hypothetical protein ACK53L_26490, partial [Pirellulaceae bacterium]
RGGPRDDRSPSRRTVGRQVRMSLVMIDRHPIAVFASFSLGPQHAFAQSGAGHQLPRFHRSQLASPGLIPVR